MRARSGRMRRCSKFSLLIRFRLATCLLHLPNRPKYYSISFYITIVSALLKEISLSSDCISPLFRFPNESTRTEFYVLSFRSSSKSAAVPLSYTYIHILLLLLLCSRVYFLSPLWSHVNCLTFSSCSEYISAHSPPINLFRFSKRNGLRLWDQNSTPICSLFSLFVSRTNLFDNSYCLREHYNSVM